ncbi:MAG: S9 family peptidase, partial [Candidatus Aminicenantes bacterium]|nr:S9 family peptidase [Candidatus Aminicenantes bacterium]
EAWALTDIKQGISGFVWSPDGKKLLLSIQDPDPDAEDKDKPEKKKPKPWVIDRLQFKRDGEGYLSKDLYTHLYVYTAADKSLTQITSGNFNESSPVWSPDGKRIAFVSNRTDNPNGNSDTNIWIVSADNPDKGQTLLQVTSNPGADSSPSWSPDGRFLTYTTAIEPEIFWYATNHLAVISAEGGEPKILTEQLDRNVFSPRFSPDGKFIYFLLEDSAENHLAKIEVSGKNLTRPISGPRSVQSYMMGKKGEIAVSISEPQLPGEIFMFENQDLRRMTEVNDALMVQLKLAEVENVQFPSKDGMEIEGFIFKPPGFDSAMRYPTILRIHGGPVAQYDFSFNFEAQLFAANGYVVVITNPRGSSGYGQDFSLGIFKSWGVKDFEDVMAGVDYAISQGYADPDRLGVGGWSYGGILTNYVITQTDRFKGAISGASEVLYRSNYGHDHYQFEWEMELGLPWENAELWEQLSPFNRVEKIVTPTLIMGGEKDWNVPILNSEQLYQALRRLGRTTQLVVYPGQTHGIRLPSFQKDRHERYLAWYAKYVKGDKD